MNRRTRLSRIKPLRGTASLQSRTPLGRTAPLKARNAKEQNAATRRTGLRPVSARRQQENRERRAMADRRWPDRREGTVMCFIPWCCKPADDLNEILPRGRGGSITDEENTIPTCREHNEELTKSPAWAYRLGVLKHDGVCCRGRDVCERYAEDGAA